ncbi:hypothetical protein FRB96_003902 [Tulasnella sp. 330]|nr:hypothetical protein FRB96_003902 [Tulasnella sp. 330]
MPQLPRFSYTITRDIHWRVEPLAYLVALLVVAILIPLNYVLTGYQVVSAASQDYNYVPSHWYYRFARRPKPGSYCDEYKFTIGDSFLTNTSILTYQLVAVFGDGDGSGATSSISYKGTTLQDCDVSYMSAIADARLQTSTIVAGVACTNETGFPVIFSTSFASSEYIDGASSTQGTQLNWQIGNLTATKSVGYAVTTLLNEAGTDLFMQVNNIFTSMPSNTGPALIAVSAINTDNSSYPPWWCSATNSTANPTCRTAIPNIPLDLEDMTLLDANGNDVDIPGIKGNYTSAITNAMQAMLAAVRLDLGNVLPTNILVNRSSEIINATIAQTFPADGSSNAQDGDVPLYDFLQGDDSIDVNIGDAERSPSNIAVEYQCRMEQRKSPGSIVIAVAVATLTLFKSGWAVFLLILTFLAKRARSEGCQTCAGHEDLEARIRDLERRGASDDGTPKLGKDEEYAGRMAKLGALGRKLVYKATDRDANEVNNRIRPIENKGGDIITTFERGGATPQKVAHHDIPLRPRRIATPTELAQWGGDRDSDPCPLSPTLPPPSGNLGYDELSSPLESSLRTANGFSSSMAQDTANITSYPDLPSSMSQLIFASTPHAPSSNHLTLADIPYQHSRSKSRSSSRSTDYGGMALHHGSFRKEKKVDLPSFLNFGSTSTLPDDSSLHHPYSSRVSVLCSAYLLPTDFTKPRQQDLDRLSSSATSSREISLRYPSVDHASKDKPGESSRSRWDPWANLPLSSKTKHHRTTSISPRRTDRDEPTTNLSNDASPFLFRSNTFTSRKTKDGSSISGGRARKEGDRRERRRSWSLTSRLPRRMTSRSDSGTLEDNYPSHPYGSKPRGNQKSTSMSMQGTQQPISNSDNIVKVPSQSRSQSQHSSPIFESHSAKLSHVPSNAVRTVVQVEMGMLSINGDGSIHVPPGLLASGTDQRPVSSSASSNSATRSKSNTYPPSSDDGRHRSRRVPRHLYPSTDPPLTQPNFIDTRSLHPSVSGSPRYDVPGFPFPPRPHSWIAEVRGCWDELALEGDDVEDALGNAIEKLVVDADGDSVGYDGRHGY